MFSFLSLLLISSIAFVTATEFSFANLSVQNGWQSFTVPPGESLQLQMATEKNAVLELAFTSLKIQRFTVTTSMGDVIESLPVISNEGINEDAVDHSEAAAFRFYASAAKIIPAGSNVVITISGISFKDEIPTEPLDLGIRFESLDTLGFDVARDNPSCSNLLIINQRVPHYLMAEACSAFAAHPASISTSNIQAAAQFVRRKIKNESIGIGQMEGARSTVRSEVYFVFSKPAVDDNINLVQCFINSDEIIQSTHRKILCEQLVGDLSTEPASGLEVHSSTQEPVNVFETTFEADLKVRKTVKKVETIESDGDFEQALVVKSKEASKANKKKHQDEVSSDSSTSSSSSSDDDSHREKKKNRRDKLADIKKQMKTNPKALVRRASKEKLKIPKDHKAGGDIEKCPFHKLMKSMGADLSKK